MNLVDANRMKKEKILLLAFGFAYVIFSMVAFTSSQMKYQVVNLIAELFWYHNTSYYFVYALSPVLIVIHFLIAKNRIASNLLIAICSYFIMELFIRRLYSLYHSSPSAEMMVIGWVVSSLFIFFFVFVAVKRADEAGFKGTYIASLTGMLISFPYHFLYVLESIARMHLN